MLIARTVWIAFFLRIYFNLALVCCAISVTFEVFVDLRPDKDLQIIFGITYAQFAETTTTFQSDRFPIACKQFLPGVECMDGTHPLQIEFTLFDV